MEREEIKYMCGETSCPGYYVHNEIVQEARPGILVIHAWRGQDAFAREKADMLARLGYVAFAIDLYGDGKVAENDDEAAALMTPLFTNRQLLRDRLSAALDTLKQQRYVNSKKIGAIGFCFGGLAAIELLRSGAGLKAAVSFHALLGDTLGDHKATTTPHGGKIDGSLLMLHGHDDPMVSDSDIKAIEKEFTDAGVDWQIHNYGHTLHAFSVPDANSPEKGTVYNEKAAKRSWQAMQNFFDECLS